MIIFKNDGKRRRETRLRGWLTIPSTAWAHRRNQLGQPLSVRTMEDMPIALTVAVNIGLCEPKVTTEDNPCPKRVSSNFDSGVALKA